jgi:hypothetical protein
MINFLILFLMVGSVAPPLPTSIKNKRKKESCWLVGRSEAPLPTPTTLSFFKFFIH